MIELVMDAISQYLARFPDAEDDLEGVAGTWLAPYRFRIDRTVIVEALERLEARGVVTRRRSVDRRTLFSRQRDRP
jgi:hypothetical protein